MTSEEFAHIVDDLGGVAKVAVLLDLHQSQISAYKTGTRKVGLLMETRIKELYAKQRGVSISEVNKSSQSLVSNAQILGDDDTVWLPFYERPVNAGRGIDIDNAAEYRVVVLRSSVPHPERSFAVKVSGDSMQACGINEESLVIAERVESGNIENYVGRIVVAGYDGAVFIKRLVKRRGAYYLHSETVPQDKYEDLPLNDLATWQIIAVVVYFKTKL